MLRYQRTPSVYLTFHAALVVLAHAVLALHGVGVVDQGVTIGALVRVTVDRFCGLDQRAKCVSNYGVGESLRFDGYYVGERCACCLDT